MLVCDNIISFEENKKYALSYFIKPSITICTTVKLSLSFGKLNIQLNFNTVVVGYITIKTYKHVTTTETILLGSCCALKALTKLSKRKCNQQHTELTDQCTDTKLIKLSFYSFLNNFLVLLTVILCMLYVNEL